MNRTTSVYSALKKVIGQCTGLAILNPKHYLHQNARNAALKVSGIDAVAFVKIKNPYRTNKINRQVAPKVVRLKNGNDRKR
jgi:hypothetical protein